jgi:hypothetical protein
MPLRIFVKKGAHRRFNRLQLDSERLQVSVEWDRRKGERRKASQLTDADKRKTDRRGTRPFTWELAEFGVVDEPNGDE